MVFPAPVFQLPAYKALRIELPSATVAEFLLLAQLQSQFLGFAPVRSTFAQPRKQLLAIDRHGAGIDRPAQAVLQFDFALQSFAFDLRGVEPPAQARQLAFACLQPPMAAVQ